MLCALKVTSSAFFHFFSQALSWQRPYQHLKSHHYTMPNFNFKTRMACKHVPMGTSSCLGRIVESCWACGLPSVSAVFLYSERENRDIFNAEVEEKAELEKKASKVYGNYNLFLTSWGCALCRLERNKILLLFHWVCICDIPCNNQSRKSWV